MIDDEDSAEALHGPPRGFWRRAVFSTDHKVIGR